MAVASGNANNTSKNVDTATTSGDSSSTIRAAGSARVISSTVDEFGLVEPIYDIESNAEMRDEIEVELTTDGQPFRGSITTLEAKHGIYRDGLGFCDFKNFDGVRLMFKGDYSATFKLKEPIDVDSLYDNRSFDYKRKFKKNGKLEEMNINCRIKGLRSKEPNIRRPVTNHPDNSTVIHIEGCEYRIPEQTIIDALSNWGEIVSNIREEVFEDPHDSEGTNRTGNYSVRMVLREKIPQLLPLFGRRVKIYHKGIQKQCMGCFGFHLRNQCKSAKVNWPDYVKDFANLHPGLDQMFFGRWWTLVSGHVQGINQEQHQKPRLEDFGVPASKELHNELLLELIKTGMSFASAEESIESRRIKYNQANESFIGNKN